MRQGKGVALQYTPEDEGQSTGYIGVPPPCRGLHGLSVVAFSQAQYARRLGQGDNSSKAAANLGERKHLEVPLTNYQYTVQCTVREYSE